MIIDIPDEIINSELENYVNNKLAAKVRDIYSKRIEEEINKRAENIYTLINQQIDKRFYRIIEAEIKNAVEREVNHIFRWCNFSPSRQPNDVFNQGVHTAYLAMAKFPSEETINKALEAAGQYLAEQIRMKTPRYKKLVDVLIENMQKEHIDQSEIMKEDKNESNY